jgi:signal transduction histidine kinase
MPRTRALYKFKNNRYLFPSLTILLIINLIALVLASVAISVIIQERGDARVSTKVEQQLNNLYIGLLDAETGQRGYIITGHSSYLAPYKNGKSEVKEALSSLKHETSDPEIRPDVTSLAKLSKRKLSELKGSIALRRQGLAPAKAEVSNDRGKNYMDKSRALLNKATAKIEAKISNKDSKARLLATIAFFVDLLALLVNIFLGYLVLLLFREQRSHGKSLEAANGELRRRSREVESVNIELERSNQELQDFAYVASHDLQEPLRKIQDFGNLLEDEFVDKLGDGRDYLDRMRGAASRMNVLIEDLLAFSRVTTKAKPFEKVDLKNVVNEVIGDLQARLIETGGRVQLTKMPTVQADPTQMRQLMQNLIGNALKFSRPGVKPVVKVSSSDIKTKSGRITKYQLFVKDNGIGFDEKYLEKIFIVFQRLHGRQKYEGTGIGLAVCRKIAERHGGEITAKSTPNKGTKFIITLPAKPPEIKKDGGANE